RGISRKEAAWWFVATWVGLFFGWGLGGCFSLDAIRAAGDATGVQVKPTGTFPPELVANGATIAALIISGTVITAVVGLIIGFSQWRPSSPGQQEEQHIGLFTGSWVEPFRTRMSPGRVGRSM